MTLWSDSDGDDERALVSLCPGLWAWREREEIVREEGGAGNARRLLQPFPYNGINPRVFLKIPVQPGSKNGGNHIPQPPGPLDRSVVPGRELPSAWPPSQSQTVPLAQVRESEPEHLPVAGLVFRGADRGWLSDGGSRPPG